MDKYKVKINPKSIRDLDSIYEYIALQKLAPETAKNQLDRLRQAVLSLDAFPESHQKRTEGRYADKGYRQLLVDNYVAIFKVDDKTNTVFVITVQYQGRSL